MTGIGGAAHIEVLIVRDAKVVEVAVTTSRFAHVGRKRRLVHHQQRASGGGGGPRSERARRPGVLAEGGGAAEQAQVAQVCKELKGPLTEAPVDLRRNHDLAAAAAAAVARVARRRRIRRVARRRGGRQAARYAGTRLARSSGTSRVIWRRACDRPKRQHACDAHGRARRLVGLARLPAPQQRRRVSDGALRTRTEGSRARRHARGRLRGLLLLLLVALHPCDGGQVRSDGVVQLSAEPRR